MALPQTAFEELGLEVLAHLLQPPPQIQWRTLKEHCGGVMGNGGGACTHIQVKCTMGERERLWKEFSRKALTEPQTRTADHTSVCFLFLSFFLIQSKSTQHMLVTVLDSHSLNTHSRMNDTASVDHPSPLHDGHMGLMFTYLSADTTRISQLGVVLLICTECHQISQTSVCWERFSDCSTENIVFERQIFSASSLIPGFWGLIY